MKDIGITLIVAIVVYAIWLSVYLLTKSPETDSNFFIIWLISWTYTNSMVNSKNSRN